MYLQPYYSMVNDAYKKFDSLFNTTYNFNKWKT